MGLKVYYKKWDSSIWFDVSQYNSKLPEWDSSLNTELLEFEISLYNPKDQNGDLFVPENGDDVCILKDNTKTSVLGNILAGKVHNQTFPIMGNILVSNNWEVVFDLRIRQRDPSDEILDFNIKEATPINDILDLIFNENEDEFGVSFVPTITNSVDGKLNGFLGGTINGVAVPRYENLADNVLIESFEAKGTPLTTLVELLKTCGYYFRIVYLVEPHLTNGINLVQKFEIFDERGITPSGDSDWVNGVVNYTLAKGYVSNLSYISQEVTPNLDRAFDTEDEITFEWDSDPINNAFLIDALIQDSLNLKNKTILADGINKVFNLEKKASDIIYVSRLITSDIVSVTSDTVFKVTLDASERLQYDESKVISGILTAVITDTSDNKYFRNFTISGETVTLTQAISGLDTSYKFALAGGLDIYQEDEDMTGINYGVIKHCKPTEYATVEFLDNDKPNIADIVSIWYYELNDRTYKDKWKAEARKHGMVFQHESLTTPITPTQFDILRNILKKRKDPLPKVTFKSYRPDILTVGMNIPITITDPNNNLTYFQRSDLLVISTKNSFISDEGKNNEPTIEQGITLSLFRENLQDIIKRFKTGNSTTINSALVKTQNSDNINIGLEFS
jgi:hypothetical protein